VYAPFENHLRIAASEVLQVDGTTLSDSLPPVPAPNPSRNPQFERPTSRALDEGASCDTCLIGLGDNGVAMVGA